MLKALTFASFFFANEGKNSIPSIKRIRTSEWICVRAGADPWPGPWFADIFCRVRIFLISTPDLSPRQHGDNAFCRLVKKPHFGFLMVATCPLIDFFIACVRFKSRADSGNINFFRGISYNMTNCTGRGSRRNLFILKIHFENKNVSAVVAVVWQ